MNRSHKPNDSFPARSYTELSPELQEYFAKLITGFNSPSSDTKPVSISITPFVPIKQEVQPTGVYDFADCNSLEGNFRRADSIAPTSGVDIDNVKDSSVTPYEVGVDLIEVAETQVLNKLHVSHEVLTLDSSSMSLSALRKILADRYNEERFPDINNIISGGTLLLRSVRAGRIDRVLAAGTDRDSTSIIMDTGYREDAIARVNGLSAQQVTYVSEHKSDWAGIGGSDHISLGLGGCLLVYDPRYLAKLGAFTNGFSVFTDNPHRALLGIIRSNNPQKHM